MENQKIRMKMRGRAKPPDSEKMHGKHTRRTEKKTPGQTEKPAGRRKKPQTEKYEGCGMNRPSYLSKQLFFRRVMKKICKFSLHLYSNCRL